MTSLEAQRAAMVREQLLDRGIVHSAVLRAFREVPRERFVPEAARDHAYEDRPLGIGSGQTISQPYVVAFMAQALDLRPSDHVLEVGAGSGYAAAILARVAADVVAVERLPELAATATAVLGELGYANVRVIAGDGSVGVPDEAPFDAICVSAGGPSVPAALLEQLRNGGRLVIPIGGSDEQRLVRVHKDSSGVVRRDDLGSVRFVPLLGEQGWHSRRGRGV